MGIVERVVEYVLQNTWKERTQINITSNIIQKRAGTLAISHHCKRYMFEY